ncbi:toxin TcdB middle/N-terminal domain-containing protein, partial [Chryseobacterium sp.]|uniref:toxin TcdB middle/N-terminal domain-containing protein n=1 Tax=Chryseobacterium sp. TaxID=1871047 RepID=UPI002FCB5D30
YSSHPRPSSSYSLGGDLGSFANLDALSNFGFGINAGVSSSSSTGSADVVYEDINGDGLIDILEVNKSTGATQVRYNLGSKFNLPVPLLKSGGDINFADETKSSNGSVTFGGSFVANFGPITLIPPAPILILWVKVGIGANVNLGLNVSETRKAFKDMNGDGFTDLVQDTNSGFIVNYSQMGRTNKLKSVTNTISKGKYLLDYEFARANYNNPHAKLIVKKISIVEPDVFSQNYTKEQGQKIETEYTFKNRKYDRRERDDFGFETVVTRVMNAGSAERISTDYYYNNSYLMNGLLS